MVTWYPIVFGEVRLFYVLGSVPFTNLCFELNLIQALACFIRTLQSAGWSTNSCCFVWMQYVPVRRRMRRHVWQNFQGARRTTKCVLSSHPFLAPVYTFGTSTYMSGTPAGAAPVPQEMSQRIKLHIFLSRKHRCNSSTHTHHQQYSLSIAKGQHKLFV